MLTLVLASVVVLAVVVEYGVVDALGSLLGVQLAQVAVLVAPLVVVDAVGHVAGLLNLGQIAAGTNGMDATGGNEEAVALLDCILGQRVADGVALYHPLILLRRQPHFQSVIERGTGCGVHDVPHLGLSVRLAVALGYLVVGVYLDAQVLVGIDKLDEQRKLVAEALVVRRPQQSSLLLEHQLVQRQSTVGSGLAALNA